MWHVWGRGEVYTDFWWGNMRERDHLKDPNLDGRVILRGYSRRGIEGKELIDMAQDRNRRRAIVNAVMNFRFA
jgi:hypothetical protein